MKKKNNRVPCQETQNKILNGFIKAGLTQQYEPLKKNNKLTAR